MPRPIARIAAVVRALEAFWAQYPDLRLAQVLHLLYERADSPNPDALVVPFYEEEAEFIKRLASVVEKY